MDLWRWAWCAVVIIGIYIITVNEMVSEENRHDRLAWIAFWAMVSVSSGLYLIDWIN